MITLSNTHASNTYDDQAVDPFTGVVIADTGSGETETVTVFPSTTADGTLSDPNAASDGAGFAGGTITLVGTAAQVSADLDALVFTPTEGQVSFGNSVTTGFTIDVQDTTGATASDTTTAVTATATAKLADLVSFNGTDGADPYASLITDANGNLFGTTAGGGTSGVGTVFEIANTAAGYAGTPTILFSFNANNGAESTASLIADPGGDLFGTTTAGGANGYGTVFEIVNTGAGYASTPATLAAFTGADGSQPYAGLTTDAAGDLFGTTTFGGANGYGTVFEIVNTATGYASTPTVLYSFGNGNDGGVPFNGLTADAAGDLFGTTLEGGPGHDGTVFEIANTASGYASAPTTLATFNGTDGNQPAGHLIADSQGDLFGTTFESDGGDGTVFEIVNTTTGYASTPTTLASFNGSDGQYPIAGLIADDRGDLFGTTEYGGTYRDGTVFEIANTTTGYAATPTTLFSFNGANGDDPIAALTADASGDLFGTTTEGGASGGGTAFELTQTGFVVAAPTIAGAVAGQTTTNEAPKQVFAGVTIGDANNAGVAIDTLTITYAGPGTLSGSTLLAGTAGDYTLTGTAATITTALRALSFTPVDGVPNTSVETTFTLSDLSAAYATPAVNGTTTLTDTDPAVPITLAATVTNASTIGHVDTLAPFSAVAISDPNAAESETATITLTNVAAGTMAFASSYTGGLSLTRSGSVYTIGAGSAAAVDAAIDALVFTPASPTVSAGTAFDLTVTDSSGKAAVKNTGTVAIDPGPTVTGTVKSNVNLGGSIDLTSAILSAAKAGLSGDTLKITSDSLSGTLGTVNLVNGDLVYAATGSGPQNIAANGTLADSFGFTISDAYGDTATGTVSVTVKNPADVINGPAYGNATIEGTSGTDIINAFGWYNTIDSNGGNDVINAGQGNATVYAGTGNVVVNLGGYYNVVSGTTSNGNDTVSGALGNTTITLGGGTDSVSVGGYYDVVSLGSGNDTITGPQGNATVTVGTGADTITLAGYNNMVTAGSTMGTDRIALGAGSETLKAGNGNFSVTAGGDSDVITLGNGTDVVTGMQGLATITTGSGNDTIILGGYGSTVNAGGGTNAITGGLGNDIFFLPPAGTGVDTITNFSLTNGDVVNLATALSTAGWTPSKTLASYLKVTEVGNTATISIATGGTGAGTPVAELVGVPGLTLANLQPHAVL